MYKQCIVCRSVVDSTSENSDAEVDSRFMKHSARRSKRKKKFKDKVSANVLVVY